MRTKTDLYLVNDVSNESNYDITEYLTTLGNILYNVLGHKEKMNYGNMIRKTNEPPKVCQYQWGFYFLQFNTIRLGQFTLYILCILSV